MKNIWIIADVPDHAYELLSKVQGKGDEITVFVNGDQSIAEECFSYGANTVKLIPLPNNTTWEQYVDTIGKEAKDVKPEIILAASTRRCKTLTAQLAAILDVPCITESKTLEINDNSVLVSRTIYGGLAEKEIEIEELPVIITVTPGIFEKQKVENPGAGNTINVEPIQSNNVSVVQRKEKEESNVNLNTADIVVGVGRGFGKQENLAYAEELANLLGGEIGCTRPVTEDFHWYPEERYIGISGVVINPKLYIAAGISGQIQHVYGVRDANTIVAINNNENSPIFKSADYYIVGDLKEVLPELIAALK